MAPPRTNYARSGDLSIAYQVFGDGPNDLLYVPGWVSHVEHIWTLPSAARFLRRLGSFSRVIMYDKRGTGLSDRVSRDRLPTIEDRVDDSRAVLEAAGSERAAVFGFSEGAAGAGIFAASHPSRVSALVMYAGGAKYRRSDDYPFGITDEMSELFANYITEHWGTGDGVALRAPSMVDDPSFQAWFAQYERLGASPGAAAQLLRMNRTADAREHVATIRVPTLLIHRTDDMVMNVGHSRTLNRLIPGSRLIELPGNDHFPWIGDADTVLDAIEEFVTGDLGFVDPDQMLATILFTDIVDSSVMLSDLGDREWATRLDRHYLSMRRLLKKYAGNEIKTTGDGLLATFDGPERAVQCALAAVDDARNTGISLRAGLHTGECQLTHNDVAGLTVHAAARILAAAQRDEVLVSASVRNIIQTPAITFGPARTQPLRGLSGTWELMTARAA